MGQQGDYGQQQQPWEHREPPPQRPRHPPTQRVPWSPQRYSQTEHLQRLRPPRTEEPPWQQPPAGPQPSFSPQPQRRPQPQRYEQPRQPPRQQQPNTRRNILAVAGGATAVILAIGIALALHRGQGTQSAGSTAGTAAGTATAAAANPVPLLEQTGATAPSGTASGQEDTFGDRYADGSYSGGESVSVYTFATAAEQQADQQRNGILQDGHALVVGHLVDIWLTAVQDASGAWVWQVTPQEVAARVHGSVSQG